MMGGMTRKIRCGGKPMTAVVLAGGRSRRMKADKASLEVGGKTLLERVLAQVGPRFDEVLVSVSAGTSGPPLPASVRARAVPDERPGLGPIGGVLAGLRAARNDACAVVACDIPDIDIPLLRALAREAGDAEIAVAVDPAGRYEPLFAVYRRAVVPAVESLLGRGERSLLPLFGLCRTRTVPLGEAGRIRNLNTRGDLEAYLESKAAAGRRGRPRARRS